MAVCLILLCRRQRWYVVTFCQSQASVAGASSAAAAGESSTAAAASTGAASVPAPTAASKEEEPRKRSLLGFEVIEPKVGPSLILEAPGLEGRPGKAARMLGSASAAMRGRSERLEGWDDDSDSGSSADLDELPCGRGRGLAMTCRLSPSMQLRRTRMVVSFMRETLN